MPVVNQGPNKSALSRWGCPADLIVASLLGCTVLAAVAAGIWVVMSSRSRAAAPTPEAPHVFVADRVWGTAGTGEGQFTSPRAVAVGMDGSVYVADTLGNRIEQFTAEGEFVRAWGAVGKMEEGTALPGTFNEIWGLAVDGDGNVFASDAWNHRIQKFSADGQFLATWGTWGLAEDGLGVMWVPRGIAVDGIGNVYVADSGNKRILVFDNDGNPLRAIGKGGALDGELDEPTGVAVASDGRVFVADTWNRRVQVFANGGAFLGKWSIGGWSGQSLDNKPQITLDEQGRVYVSDPEGYRVLVFTDGGQLLYMFGDFGVDASTFSLPTGLAVKAGFLYVTDTNGNRVMRFGVK